jgi:hypothetical protein
LNDSIDIVIQPDKSTSSPTFQNNVTICQMIISHQKENVIIKPDVVIQPNDYIEVITKSEDNTKVYDNVII